MATRALFGARRYSSVGEATLARRATSYKGLSPASERASAAARGSSRKSGTRPELLLRRELTRLGLRYRVANDLPGRPDVVFPGARVAVFADGDYWHGRDLDERVRKLRAGHNAKYWVAKIRANVERDRRRTAELEAQGWLVLRFWESEIAEDAAAAAADVLAAVRKRLVRRS